MYVPGVLGLFKLTYVSKIVPLLGNYTKDNSQIPLGIVCNFINFILKKAKFPSTIVMCDLFTSLGHFTASFKMSFYISSTEEMLFTVGKHSCDNQTKYATYATVTIQKKTSITYTYRSHYVPCGFKY